MIFENEYLPLDMQKYTFNVILMDLPPMVGETIFHNADDSFTILINSRWSTSRQKDCFEHALNHVRNDDWEKENVQEIEYENHKK